VVNEDFIGNKPEHLSVHFGQKVEILQHSDSSGFVKVTTLDDGQKYEKKAIGLVPRRILSQLNSSTDAG
jgi:hypothetical protein